MVLHSYSDCCANKFNSINNAVLRNSEFNNDCKIRTITLKYPINRNMLTMHKVENVIIENNYEFDNIFHINSKWIKTITIKRYMYDIYLDTSGCPNLRNIYR